MRKAPLRETQPGADLILLAVQSILTAAFAANAWIAASLTFAALSISL
jgi:hypothetical protein